MDFFDKLARRADSYRVTVGPLGGGGQWGAWVQCVRWLAVEIVQCVRWLAVEVVSLSDKDLIFEFVFMLCNVGVDNINDIY